MSLPDLCPTFLEAAGVNVPGSVTARSLLPVLLSKKAGRVDAKRNHAIFGRERHGLCRLEPTVFAGYPCRAIRNDEYLYIRNFKPDRWPAGAAKGRWDSYSKGVFGDADIGPTKDYLIDNQGDPTIKKYFDLSFAKRPAEELYVIAEDPFQINNVAADPRYAKVKAKLSSQLTEELKNAADPRVIGGGEKFDEYPYKDYLSK